MDYKRKPIIILCRNCHRPTPHHTVADKPEKLVWLACDICGDWRLFNYW